MPKKDKARDAKDVKGWQNPELWRTRSTKRQAAELQFEATHSGIIPEDVWNDIVLEFRTAYEDGELTKQDLGVLMAMCAMYVVDPANVVNVPPQLASLGEKVSLVREDPIALTNLSAMFGLWVRNKSKLVKLGSGSGTNPSDVRTRFD